MSAAPYALEPGRIERTLRAGIILYVSLLVAVPLLALVNFGVVEGADQFVHRISSPVASHALWLTVWTALLVGALNTVIGTLTAWVLVRYKLPGKTLLSALVDLPLSIPTLVAGVMLILLYGPTSGLGIRLAAAGFEVAFAPPGIVLALSFVTLPFVVRAVEPVLAEIDPAEEEAAVVLGAGPFHTFRTVFLPALLPVAISGGIRSTGRALGEFGSIVVIAGNIPMETLTAPVFIFGEIESGAARSGAALSVVLLAFALLLHALATMVERRTGARHV